VDEALERANDTRYGLHAGIFTSELATARRAIEELDFGGVIVNDVPTWRADQMPYGGVRDSGNTREGPAYTIREMTELRSAVLA
jgi:acyl-CoA reductase-like NAD-dependent aldehyde dehydrogenase